MLLEVRQLGDPVLRQVARDVPAVTPHVVRLLDDMLETMKAEMGVGLAAPQIGISKRLVVIGLGERVFRMINPEIVAASGDQPSHEACLSIPGAEGQVERAAKVTVRYTDEKGARRKLTAIGLLSRVLQHELDHLYGILFVDRLGIDKVLALPGELDEVREFAGEEQAVS